MSQKTPAPQRVHHFYASIAKFVFHHPEHGIVSVEDPIRLKVAEGYGLSPLIIYGMTVAGLPIRWMTITPALSLGRQSEAVAKAQFQGPLGSRGDRGVMPECPI